MGEIKVEEKKLFYKKWWFWIIVLAIVIVISFTIIIGMAFNNTTTGIHKVALSVQNIDNESTVYTSAGENTIVIEIPNYTDDSKKHKEEAIVSLIRDFANDGGILSNYSKVVLCEKINSDTNIEDYFLITKVYSLPSMTQDVEQESIYIDFVEYSKQTSYTSEKGEDITLTAGKYIVGTDIKAGKYDAIAQANSGNFFVNGSTSVNEILSAKNDSFGIPQYSNLTLKQGDTVEIRSGLSVKLQAK